MDQDELLGNWRTFFFLLSAEKLEIMVTWY